MLTYTGRYISGSSITEEGRLSYELGDSPPGVTNTVGLYQVPLEVISTGTGTLSEYQAALEVIDEGFNTISLANVALEVLHYRVEEAPQGRFNTIRWADGVLIGTW